MIAFTLNEIGRAPALTEVPVPSPAAGEIRVRIAACALNFADLLMIEGRYQERPEPPFTLGLELSGTVDALGPGVAGPAPGTRVAVYAGTGGLAEFGCFPAARCLPIPDEMPFDIAAAFQIAYGTSHLALTRRARLAAGETLVVLGAAGGVGLTAVELGRHLGARVIAVARGADRLAVAEAAGAHALVDATDPDLRARIQDLGGSDIVYDTVGGPIGEAAMRTLRPEGRYLAIGFAGGTVPSIAANHLLVKNIEVIGLYWGGYLRFNPGALTTSLSCLLDMYQTGAIRPHISYRFPLARASEALAVLRDRKSTGKVVVLTEPSR